MLLPPIPSITVGSAGRATLTASAAPGTVGPRGQLDANRASSIFAATDTADITAYIELNPQVRFGKPVVKGTRTTVAEVLEMLANGMSAADIAEDFPAIGAA